MLFITPRTAAVGGAALVLVLAGCAAATDAAAGGEEAATFAACLTANGLEAQIGEHGHVLVKRDDLRMEGEPDEAQQMQFEIDGSGAGAQALRTTVDDDGVFWVAPEHAAYFADDPDTQDAYAACEAEHPEFSQPAETGLDDVGLRTQLADQQEDGLAFAGCARDAGFGWVADPEPNSGGAIVLPLDLAENEFRALLTACHGDELNGVTWSIDTETGELDGFDWFAVLDEFTSTD